MSCSQTPNADGGGQGSPGGHLTAKAPNPAIMQAKTLKKGKGGKTKRKQTVRHRRMKSQDNTGKATGNGHDDEGEEEEVKEGQKEGQEGGEAATDNCGPEEK